MGRPSKLNDRQRGEIGRRLALGEKPAALAREFKVSRTTMNRCFSDSTETIKEVATMLAKAEGVMDTLPISEQVSIRTLADHLKGISSNLADAAHTSSRTAARLHAKAAEREARVVGDDLSDLPAIAALTKTANEAATLGMGILNANRSAVAHPEELFTPDVAAKMLSLQKGSQ